MQVQYVFYEAYWCLQLKSWLSNGFASQASGMTAKHHVTHALTDQQIHIPCLYN